VFETSFGSLDMKNFAVFACGVVGIEAIKLFSDDVEKLKLVVLDSKNFKEMNGEIIDLMNLFKKTKLCYHDQIDIEEIKKMEIDLIILAWWPYKIKSPLLEMPKMGFLNTHPSYLPYCKGKNPNFWSIVSGEPFGASLHLINENLDSGPIVCQEEIPYTWEDTGESLYKKSIDLICKLLRNNKENILNLTFTLKQQSPNKGSFHWAKEIDEKSLIVLDREYKAKDILNLLRARTFKPYPAAYFYDNDEMFEVRVEIKKSSPNFFNKKCPE